METVVDLGEHKIIELILKQLKPMPNMPVPFGDDVSAVDIGRGELAVLKTDMLVGKTDVPPKMTLWQAARKAVIMNISDLAAKGVKTIALLTSLGVPRSFQKRDIEQIADGLNQGAREYDAYVLGGDTSESSDLIISCAAFGIGDKKHLILRSGAKPNDLVAVTGLFGKTAVGLRILLQNLKAPTALKRILVESVLNPHARLWEGLALAAMGALTSSIDSSDGLAWSLHEISRASNVGFLIDRLPIAEEAEQIAKLHGLDPVELCLYGGEEYELVVTVKQEKWQKACKQVPLIRIGRVTKEKGVVLKRGKNTLPIEARGWEHFKTSLHKPQTQLGDTNSK
jgi:thiamine-monophosphate kinase